MTRPPVLRLSGLAPDEIVADNFAGGALELARRILA